jgi:hypothetical protein
MGKIIISTASRPVLGPTQPLQWVPGCICLDVKRPGREADHSPPSTAEVKSGGAVPPLSHMWMLLNQLSTRTALPLSSLNVNSMTNSSGGIQKQVPPSPIWVSKMFEWGVGGCSVSNLSKEALHSQARFGRKEWKGVEVYKE